MDHETRYGVELRHVEWKALFELVIQQKRYYESIGSDDTAEWWLEIAGQMADQVGEQVED